MLSRIVSNNATRSVMCHQAQVGILYKTNPVRTYATLKEVEMRLKSIKNIEKITKTMKIVASTRLSKAEKAKVSAKKMDEAEQLFYKNAETKNLDVEATETGAPRELIVAITSDKGLCGSIHSQLAKAVRRHLNDQPNADIVTIGDKIKMQLLRTHPNNIKLSINGIGKDAPTFQESALIADKLLSVMKAGTYPKISIFYNDPVSSLSFEPSEKPIFNAKTIEQSPSFGKFEIDTDANVPRDLFEYTLANQMLTAMAQGYAAEISARRNAMDNASKNAGDMINRYSILYNRTRQAVITNELVDIITGASSLG
ncbi:BAH_G0002310.mRNA.1.CDS.1 [Saccharomyces cerevisiae]|nr:SX2_G0014490.mRNA.1.CDS.1 [Saccharomyces cerevisiae]CAI4256763.1 BAH_G0002310.mRNA.1.CDS.1 [Saccharomyces cerevisiae]CAI4257726.1 BAG_1a_G0002320.mRNA.1.CDS.1 [Saccharomyces cerevisiae]CAI7041912.1 BAG_1a_G0002320.mRNA.1.CDS.1 [Saccharomyces cerevisiae]CAI7041927.1 BAH_G0002310.mRNA.1.CDS.1 [Saccharomyces cerevisiae]